MISRNLRKMLIIQPPYVLNYFLNSIKRKCNHNGISYRVLMMFCAFDIKCRRLVEFQYSNHQIGSNKFAHSAFSDLDP